MIENDFMSLSPIETLETVFILMAWTFGIFAWYFGYQVYALTRDQQKHYIYFFFGGLSVGMVLVLRIFGLLKFYNTESWLVAYDFFLMVSAVLMLLGFRGMYKSIED